MFSLKQVKLFVSRLVSNVLMYTLTRLPDMMKYVSEALQSGLKDKSAYVRKTAVLGIVKVFHIDPGVIDSESIVGRKKDCDFFTQ